MPRKPEAAERREREEIDAKKRERERASSATTYKPYSFSRHVSSLSLSFSPSPRPSSRIQSSLGWFVLLFWYTFLVPITSVVVAAAICRYLGPRFSTYIYTHTYEPVPPIRPPGETFRLRVATVRRSDSTSRLTPSGE